MGPLQTRITADMKAALKAGDKDKLGVLSMLIAALKDEQLKLCKDEFDEADELVVLQRAIKARKDAVAQAEELGRADVADHERAEIPVIEVYMPEMLTGDALVAKVREVADELGFSGPKDTGRFMKEFMGRFKGQVEGRDVQAAIKQLG